jgi:hypothetical protein
VAAPKPKPDKDIDEAIDGIQQDIRDIRRRALPPG